MAMDFYAVVGRFYISSQMPDYFPARISTCNSNWRPAQRLANNLNRVFTTDTHRFAWAYIGNGPPAKPYVNPQFRETRYAISTSVHALAMG